MKAEGQEKNVALEVAIANQDLNKQLADVRTSSSRALM